MSKLRHVWVSPSDINHLYDRCQRCWYRKINRLQKPKEILPGIFNRIDRGMKDTYDVETLKGFGIEAHSIVRFEKVKSIPIEYPDLGLAIVINGKMDKGAVLDDQSLALCEFKTTEYSPERAAQVKKQLHAYEMALRFPEGRTPEYVSEMHLICFQPYEEGSFRVKQLTDGTYTGALLGELKHSPFEIDRAWFEAFLEGMARVAASPDLPEAGQNCEYCHSVADAFRYDKSKGVAA